LVRPTAVTARWPMVDRRQPGASPRRSPPTIFAAEGRGPPSLSNRAHHGNPDLQIPRPRLARRWRRSKNKKKHPVRATAVPDPRPILSETRGPRAAVRRGGSKLVGVGAPDILGPTTPPVNFLPLTRRVPVTPRTALMMDMPCAGALTCFLNPVAIFTRPCAKRVPLGGCSTVTKKSRRFANSWPDAAAVLPDSLDRAAGFGYLDCQRSNASTETA